ncbi:MAG TPA: DUF721 domain-containing protein [Prolixibacteraceae bacterium]|nr:DUF721 domain-containing protein [Prolixibacteraceae bacterium]
MRRKETLKISEILNEFSAGNELGKKLRETRLMNNWNTMLGPVIARATEKIQINNRVLIVHINSSVIRHELFMIRSQIVESLNKSVGGNVIDSILFR